MTNIPDLPDLSALWPLLPPWIEWVAMASLLTREGVNYGYAAKTIKS